SDCWPTCATTGLPPGGGWRPAAGHGEHRGARRAPSLPARPPESRRAPTPAAGDGELINAIAEVSSSSMHVQSNEDSAHRREPDSGDASKVVSPSLTSSTARL